MALSARLRQLKGKATKGVQYEVEKGQIRRFAAAVGELNPIHQDEKDAKKGGFTTLVATPTFPAALIDVADWLDELGVDLRTTMHAEEEYEYYRTICAGDVVVVVHKIVDAYEKTAPNGKLNFIVVESRGTDKRSRDVFKGRRVLVELNN